MTKSNFWPISPLQLQCKTRNGLQNVVYGSIMLKFFSGGSSNLWKPVGFVAKQNSDFWFFWDTLLLIYRYITNFQCKKQNSGAQIIISIKSPSLEYNFQRSVNIEKTQWVDSRYFLFKSLLAPSSNWCSSPRFKLDLVEDCWSLIFVLWTEIRIDGLHLFPAKGLSLLLGSSNNAMFVAFLQCGWAHIFHLRRPY